MAIQAQTQPHIEVHKFYGGAVVGVAFLALVIQAFLNKFGGKAASLELPLLVTLYFGLSRRNPSTGLLLGFAIGILQDGVSHVPVGLYGIAKTLVGYLASTIGARIDVEHPVSRFAFAFLFFHFHQAVLTVTERLLLDRPVVFYNRSLLIASLLNAVVAVPLFLALDHLRKHS